MVKKKKAAVRVVAAYDVAADAKRRISLKQAKAKYFHVKVLSDGSYLLEPRVLVPLGVQIDGFEKVEAPVLLRPLMDRLGQAMDRLPD